MAKRDLQSRLQRDENEIKVLFFLILALVLILIVGGWNLYSYFQTSITDIYNASLKAATPSSSTPTEAPTPTPTTKAEIENLQPAVKEYFVPLGSGSSQADDWADVPGLQAKVNFSNYPNIKEVRFEASVQVPTANQIVYVRLYNVTDKHPVWYSDVTMEGASAYVISNPIIYDKGEKTYQVQMKTQLRYTTNLTQSRIHITLR